MKLSRNSKAGLLFIGALSLGLGNIIIDRNEKKEILRHENIRLVKLLYAKTAGIDRMFDSRERGYLMKDLGLTHSSNPINSEIYFTTSDNLKSVEARYPDGSLIGKITTQELGKYVLGSDYKIPNQKKSRKDSDIIGIGIGASGKPGVGIGGVILNFDGEVEPGFTF